MKVIQASIDDKETIKNLYQLYLHDLSLYSCLDADEKGLFPLPKYFDFYWIESDRIPLSLVVNDKMVGFCFVRILGITSHQISEFFILRSYRGRGFGKKFATLIYTTHLGQWRVCQLKNNVPARLFWKNVILEYTNNNFTEQESLSEPIGYMQLFSNANQDHDYQQS